MRYLYTSINLHTQKLNQVVLWGAVLLGAGYFSTQAYFCVLTIQAVILTSRYYQEILIMKMIPECGAAYLCGSFVQNKVQYHEANASFKG